MASPKTVSPTPKPLRHGKAKGVLGGSLIKKEVDRIARSGKFKIALKPKGSGVVPVRHVKILIKTVGDGLIKSRKSGRSTRFLVELNPDGSLRILWRASPSTTSMAAAQPATAVDDGELERALEAARARGRSKAAEILDGEEMLSADQFATLLGVSRVTVNAKRQKHEVLALDGAKRGYRFPSWQLDENGKPFTAIPRLFEHLGGSGWTIYRFLVQRHPELDGLSALEALNSGTRMR